MYEYTFGDVSWRKHCCLAAMQTPSKRLRTRFQQVVSVLYGSLGADFTGYRREGEVTMFEVPLFLVVWGCIDDAQNLAGVFVGDVWNELKGICERTDDETVITARG